MPKIRIITKVSHVTEIEYNNEYYQDMTLAEAIEFEKNLEIGEILQDLTETYQFLEEDQVSRVPFDLEVHDPNVDNLYIQREVTVVD